jgi:hypothetical protein
VPRQKNEGRRSARGRAVRGHDTRAERVREREAVAEASYGHGGGSRVRVRWWRSCVRARVEAAAKGLAGRD